MWPEFPSVVLNLCIWSTVLTTGWPGKSPVWLLSLSLNFCSWWWFSSTSLIGGHFSHAVSLNGCGRRGPGHKTFLSGQPSKAEASVEGLPWSPPTASQSIHLQVLFVMPPESLVSPASLHGPSLAQSPSPMASAGLPSRLLASVYGINLQKGSFKNVAPTLVFLPGESHGQRSLAGYSPWGLKRHIVRYNLAT